MKTIYAVLHGDKHEGADPTMTPSGVNQIESLKDLLPDNPSAIICGTGRRHRHVAATLGLEMTRSTLLLGDATSMDTIDGNPTIIFADGTACWYEQYTGIQDMAPAIHNFLRSLPDQAVLCTGRPFAKSLGIEVAKSGSVVEITIDDNDELGCSILEQLGETEA
ncbi:MAG: hypothetical protein A2406_02515 [Candidatus Komeilibacteria bacterium RIFOXYC1_FULL_37_11]|uniref:Phosphoglycerate mutase n=1 Tax=Candidatus Komeilibacteria bacterium RIFOXYC1_FULL_37_11 TaxID=1798555 RepID=A0A1G2BZT1_9BACT|nr:MAG: hypothetical protein A2406_02515 [Candidatus Komeilibacteria bacterium RIFOXYC1_FULL_37_11]OGY95473.1 MAG: hypothetical protein A2611_02110 [Candidatus Komeilibacteria bacterium RIFOXYD1_FULL_37_29]